MIYVGLDLSIDSTAATIYKNGEYIHLSYTDKKENNVWIQSLKNIVPFEFLKYDYKNIDNFSDQECLELMEFENVASKIYQDLDSFIDDDVIIGIESYNFGQAAGNSIVDIVAFSTLVKIKLNRLMFFGKLKKIELIPPKSLKLWVSELVYQFKYALPKSKNVSRSPDGIAGGSFKKSHILNAFIDYGFQLPITNLIIENKNKLIAPNGDVKAPYNDIIDSIWLCEWVKLKYS